MYNGVTRGDIMNIPFKDELKDYYPALLVYLRPAKIINYENGKLDVCPKGYELASDIVLCKDVNNKIVAKRGIEVKSLDLLYDDYINCLKLDNEYQEKHVCAYAVYYNPSKKEKIVPWKDKSDNIIEWVIKNIDNDHDFNMMNDKDSLLNYILYLINNYYRKDYQYEVKKYVDEEVQRIDEKVKK